MKYLKYFENHTSTGKPAITRCTVLVYTKTGIDKFNGKWNCERKEDKVFTGNNSLDNAIKWSKKKINDDNVGGVVIYKNLKDIKVLRWWYVPNSNAIYCNTLNDPEKDASNLSRYLFGMTQAYLIFGKDYPEQHKLCNIIRTKAPKSWDSIQKSIGDDKSKDMNNAADMDNMGFLDD